MLRIDIKIRFARRHEDYVRGQFNANGRPGAVNVHSAVVLVDLRHADGEYQYPNCLNPNGHKPEDIVILAQPSEGSMVCSTKGRLLKPLYEIGIHPFFASHHLCTVSIKFVENVPHVRIEELSTELHWPAARVTMNKKVLYEGSLEDLPVRVAQFQKVAREIAEKLLQPKATAEAVVEKVVVKKETASKTAPVKKAQRIKATRRAAMKKPVPAKNSGTSRSKKTSR